MIAGYRIPGNNAGQAFTLPDFCFGKVSEAEADAIADAIRKATGQEPHWQTVRGKLIRLAHQAVRAEMIRLERAKGGAS